MPMCSSERGFTLLELMTVVLLIGLLAGVGLSMDFSDTADAPPQQMQRLAQQFTLASEEAVLSGAVLGLDFYRSEERIGYRWLLHDGKHWLAAEPSVFDAESNATLLPAQQQLRLRVDGESIIPEALQDLSGDDASRFAPDVLLLPTREFTPFFLVLGDGSSSRQMSVDALGRVEVGDATIQ